MMVSNASRAMNVIADEALETPGNYFDAHVINLPSRADRRAEFAAELARVGWSARWFAAVRPEDAGEFESIGARGCFLSHLALLRQAGPKPLLIFEDDLNFSGDFAARIGAVIERLSVEPWGIFYGSGGVGHMEPIPANQEIRSTHMVAFNVPVIPRLVAYLDAMLERPAGDPDGGPMHVDGAYSWFRKENPDVITRAAVPALGYQRSSRTNIHAHGWHDRLPGVSHAVAALRRLRNARR